MKIGIHFHSNTHNDKTAQKNAYENLQISGIVSYLNAQYNQINGWTEQSISIS